MVELDEILPVQVRRNGLVLGLDLGYFFTGDPQYAASNVNLRTEVRAEYADLHKCANRSHVGGSVHQKRESTGRKIEDQRLIHRKWPMLGVKRLFNIQTLLDAKECISI